MTRRKTTHGQLVTFPCVWFQLSRHCTTSYTSCQPVVFALHKILKQYFRVGNNNDFWVDLCILYIVGILHQNSFYYNLLFYFTILTVKSSVLLDQLGII